MRLVEGEDLAAHISREGPLDPVLAVTLLTQVADGYFLYDSGTSSGPQLKYGGAAYVAGQFGGWTPIGASATWKMRSEQRFLFGAMGEFI